MELSLNTLRARWKPVCVFLEDLLATLANVIYAALPLFVLLIVYSVIGLTSWLDIFGGPDAMFVALVALIDASRDSVKFISLSPDEDDKDNLDALMTLSVILVVLAAVILALSIAVDKHAIILTAPVYELFGKSVSLMLPVSLWFAWFHKFRLKRREKKLVKEKIQRAGKLPCQCKEMH